jgi:hypothetical protein
MEHLDDLFACTKLGAVLQGINWRHAGEEIEEIKCDIYRSITQAGVNKLDMNLLLEQQRRAIEKVLSNKQ